MNKTKAPFFLSPPPPPLLKKKQLKKEWGQRFFWGGEIFAQNLPMNPAKKLKKGKQKTIPNVSPPSFFASKNPVPPFSGFWLFSKKFGDLAHLKINPSPPVQKVCKTANLEKFGGTWIGPLAPP